MTDLPKSSPHREEGVRCSAPLSVLSRELLLVKHLNLFFRLFADSPRHGRQSLAVRGKLIRPLLNKLTIHLDRVSQFPGG